MDYCPHIGRFCETTCRWNEKGKGCIMLARDRAQLEWYENNNLMYLTQKAANKAVNELTREEKI